MKNATLYIILGTAVLGVVSVLGIEALRPTTDNTQLIVTVLGFLAPTMISLIDTLKTDKVRHSMTEVHSNIASLSSQINQKAEEAKIDPK